MVVPIKFRTLNLQRGSEVGVIPATPKGPLCILDERQSGFRLSVASMKERKRKGEERRGAGCEWMSSPYVAPGSLPGGATQ